MLCFYLFGFYLVHLLLFTTVNVHTLAVREKLCLDVVVFFFCVWTKGSNRQIFIITESFTPSGICLFRHLGVCIDAWGKRGQDTKLLECYIISSNTSVCACTYETHTHKPFKFFSQAGDVALWMEMSVGGASQQPLNGLPWNFGSFGLWWDIPAKLTFPFVSCKPTQHWKHYTFLIDFLQSLHTLSTCDLNSWTTMGRNNIHFHFLYLFSLSRIPGKLENVVSGLFTQ